MARVQGTLVAAVLAVAGGLSLLAGCNVEEHKGANGDDNVKIATPFGGVSVKTNEQAVEGGVGLTVYPGSVLVKKDNGKDNGAADINMSFGSFHLGVKALSYKTEDNPGKVEAFYRKDMKKFGTVILCEGNRAVGTPDHTQDGLSCADDKKSKVDTDGGSSNRELKAGSRQHQHIVSMNPDGGGTKIGLIALELPTHFGIDEDDKDKD